MTRTLVIGLDTASNRWHAVGRSENRLVLWQSMTAEGNPDQRRTLLTDGFEQFLDRLAARQFASHAGLRVHIFAEEPLVIKGNGQTTRLLCLAAGALWDRHLRYDVFWHWVDVAVWQSFVGAATGKSDVRKEKAREWACIQRGVNPDDIQDWDDEPDYWDADCLAHYGTDWLSKAEVVAKEV